VTKTIKAFTVAIYSEEGDMRLPSPPHVSFKTLIVTLATSFASWIIGGEFIRVLISTVLDLTEPVGGFLAYALTGALLGAINGLILQRFAGRAGLFVSLGVVGGAAAGWILALTLTALTAPTPTDPRGWVFGLASFIAIAVGTIRLLAFSPLQPAATRVQGQQLPVARASTSTSEESAQKVPIQHIQTARGGAEQETATPITAHEGETTPGVAKPEPGLATEAHPTQPTPGTTTAGIGEGRPHPPPAALQSIEEIEEALMEMILEEDVRELVPLPNNTSPEGGSYPELESRLGTETTDLLKVVKRLVDKNYLRIMGVEFKKVACPHCLSTLNMLTLRCRVCGSLNLGRQRILQHEACGFLGPEDSFLVDGRTICPRCGSNVKLHPSPLEEGEEVLKVHSSFFICYNCNEVNPDPHITFKCITCGADYDLGSLEFKTFYRYAVNPEVVSAMKEQRIPLKLIKEEFESRGYEVQLNARISGSSKVRHKVDLLYSRGEKLGAIFLFSDRGGTRIHDLMKIIVMKADTRIENVNILCLGHLDVDSRRLAELYNIRVIEDVASMKTPTEVVNQLLG